MKKERLLILIPIAIVILDHLSKKMIKAKFALHESHELIGNFLRLTYLENSGIAFGLFGNFLSSSPLLKNILFTCVTLGAVVFIIYLIRQSKDYLSKIALYTILGGALGNILERIFGHILYFGDFKIFYGRVVDFLDLGIGFSPDRLQIFGGIFNIADSFVTIGVALLIIHILFFENKKKKTNA